MNYKTILTTLVFLLIGVPTLLLAATPPPYSPLVGIPGVTDPGLSFGDYINALYALSISIAALMAVIKIIIAGMKYMLSDVVTSKSEAISDIQGAVFGLIIVISAVLILTVINPQLTTTNVFLDTIQATAKPSSPVTPGTTITKHGYKYAVATTVSDFKTTCESGGGVYKIESDAGNNYDVCYDPLSPAMVSEIEATYTGQNTTAIKQYYQTLLFPNLDPTAKGMVSVKLGVGEDKVLLVIRKKDPGNWLDRNVPGKMGTACFDLQKAKGGSVNYKEVTIGSDTFFTCIKN